MPPRKTTTFKDGITIAIPAYNEEGSLERTALAALAALDDAAPRASELLIVDDGSGDGTAQIASAIAARDNRVRVHTHSRNMGFAAAQRACYRFATLDWVFLLPADGQIDPPSLLSFIPLCEKYDLILGATKPFTEPGVRGATSAAFHALSRALFDLPDGDFGACLMVRRELADSFNYICKTPVAMTELAVRAAASGAKVTTLDVQKKRRGTGSARGGAMLAQSPKILAEIASLYIEMKLK